MDKDLIRKAAAMLAEEARLVRESCMVGEREWTCEDCGGRHCESRAHWEDLATTADKLLAQAA